MKNKIRSELPDLFLSKSGKRINTYAAWTTQRKKLYNTIINIEYGGLPTTPSSTYAEELHSTTFKNYGGVRIVSYRIVTGPDHPFHFYMRLLIPSEKKEPFPVVLTGDACWLYATDEVIGEVIKRGNIFAQFNRVEIVPDNYRTERNSGLYLAYPNMSYGALAAWAWGYHRCVDALLQMDFVDRSKITITGHSRGGKTVLLAGATDERIALTCANNSGAGGAGCYRVQGEKSETLADLMRAIPYWFGPEMKQYIGREEKLPFDQHFLKALVAPRPLLTTEALGDLWANPQGTLQTHWAAREVYHFLGAEDKIGIWFRKGGHEHGIGDWKIFLDFMDWHFHGKKPHINFNPNPFPKMRRAFSWKAPKQV